MKLLVALFIVSTLLSIAFTVNGFNKLLPVDARVARERTLVVLKPDSVQRGVTGKVISRFEKKGFKPIAMKMLIPSMELAQEHYGEHRNKSFFLDVTRYLTSGPVFAMVSSIA